MVRIYRALMYTSKWCTIMTDRPHPLVPKLRFPEFVCADDWRSEQISNIASITKGKGISKADIDIGGAIPCIRYAELYTHYSEVIHEVVSSTNVPHNKLVLSQAEDVLVPASGETKSDIAKASCVLTAGIALGSDLNILRSDLYGPFFSYLLNSPLRHKIARVAQGDTVAHLYPKQISQVGLAYPSRLEQKKIADCLGSLDDLIAVETQKLKVLRQQKQGLMQQLFPQSGETVPRLRFPEFENAEPWEPIQLKEVLAYEQPGKYIVKDSSYLNTGTPVLTANKSFVLGYTAETDGIYRNVPAIIFDDFTTDTKYVDFAFKIKSSAIKILTSRRGDELRFVFELISRVRFDPTQHKRYYISQYQNLEIAMPNRDEQQKIADCLGSLDDLISVEGKKLKVLQQHKQGLMQQLFPCLETK